MSTVQQIEAAIQKLPRDEFWKLAKWFDDQRNEVWDREIEQDAQPGGRLDKLARQALKEIETGETEPLEEFLRHP
jgi:hypothetical protein